MGIPRKRSTGRRLAAGLALCSLVGIVAVGTAGASKQQKPLTLADNMSPVVKSTYTGAKSDSGRIAKTDPSLLNRTDGTPVAVMIKYDFDPVASYRGSVNGYAATSPSVTGKKITQNKSAAADYRSYIGSQAFEINSRAQQSVPGLTVRQPFLNVYGGVAATVPANEIGALLQVPGVVAVQKDTLEQPQDDNTAFIGATDVWPSLGGSGTAASNVTVGVLDTGIWPEHPMMSAVGEPAPAGGMVAGCEFGDGTDTTNLGPTFNCNNKLIGAWAETATYMALTGASANEFCDALTGECSARDSEGHGTHTTTTAAGRCVSSAVLYGVQRGPVCGIAPGAHVIMYRVCLAGGCFSSDSVAAVDQAILDGVDVINFSISGGANPYTDPVELAFLDATNAGISVNASAGNSGPGAGTSDHGGPWTTTVGASTGPRAFTSTLHLTGNGATSSTRDSFDIQGVTLTDGISVPTPVVLAQNLPGEDQLCQSVLGSGAATGKIVLCMRGTNARVDKGYNVAQGGAAGMVLYNVGNQDVETDNHWLPAIHVNGPDTALLNFVNTHTNVMGMFDQGTATPATPDVMATFSSRGPTGSWIKPDVTAPGIQVLAGMTPQPTGITNGPPGNFFQAIAGTSMSSPHSAGASALVKAVHPGWDPEMIKSALMTSSSQGVVKEDGVTPADPFDRGAGSIRVNNAVNPTLVFDENGADFAAFGSDSLNRIDLNLASIDAPTMPGQITTQRTAINVTGKSQTLNVSTTAPAGAQIIVSTAAVGKKGGLPKPAKNLKASPSHPLTFFVTIVDMSNADGWYFGQITLTPKGGSTPVVMPVAYDKGQGDVTLTNSCTPTSFAPGASTACSSTVTNLSSSTATNTMLSIAPSKKLALGLNVPASASAKSTGPTVNNKGVITWSGDLTPAIAPAVNSITDITGTGPDGPGPGYFPISLVGGTLLSSAGDDTIANLGLPVPFYYGGEAYSTIGIVSNGYLVVGGGTSTDIQFFPQTFPNAARPNNVMALFWSDLNPSNTGAGHIYYGIFNVGDGSRYLVIDWEGVANFDGLHTHSFQAWIRLSFGATVGPTSEWNTYSYGSPGAGTGDGASGQGFGAENRDGSSGVNMTNPANNTDWQINTSPPAAGGSVTVNYTANAKKAGTYQSTASMTSDLTRGTTQVVQTLTVGAAGQ